MALPTGFAGSPVILSFEDVGAGTDVEHAVIKINRKLKITAVDVASHAAVVADGTNYVTIALKNGANTVGSFDTSTTGLTAKTFRAMTLTAAQQVISADSTLTVDATHSGTGVAVSNPVVQIEFEIVD